MSRDAVPARARPSRVRGWQLYLNRKITGALVGVQRSEAQHVGHHSKAGAPDYLRGFMEMKTVAERF